MAIPFSSDTLAEVRLASVRGVGPLTRRRLIDAFGDAVNVLGASEQQLAAVQGVGPKLATSILEAPDDSIASQELEEAAAWGIYVVRSEESSYPPRLRELYDAPAVLYCRGAIEASDERAIAVVGTRRATHYGLRQAERIASGLARAGVTVVSGLARGIDAVAHRAALDAGGRTIAVLAGGLMSIYPPEHKQLADSVADQGALLAESPPRMPPMSGSFPQRNRIISGASLGVVVIEAAERSGALITARHAAEQGRDAFAVPGPVDSAASQGCHRLVQEGAKLVTTVDDILEELESLPLQGGSIAPFDAVTASSESVDKSPQLSEMEKQLWDAVSEEPTPIDSVVEATELPVERVLATLSVLESRGVLRRVSGALICRA